MSSKNKSIIFWVIFLIMVLAIVVVLFTQRNALSKTFSESQARNFASSITASTAANYSLRKSNPSKGMSIQNCKDVVNLKGIHLPPGYEITGEAIMPGQVVFCTLSGPKMDPIQFSVIGIG